MAERASSRRKTLGVVNVNGRQGVGLNAPNDVFLTTNKPSKSHGRKSMAPRVASADGQSDKSTPLTPGGRKGLTPSKRQHRQSSMTRVDRRQSVFVLAPKCDPRPISDKAYFSSCIRKVASYLDEKGFDEHLVSNKALARPSGKIVQAIITFLLRLIDPNFSQGNLKFEDEVPLSFKLIGYPFPISKTGLLAAGSPHAWPGLLAALAWLVDHLRSLDIEDQQEKQGMSLLFREATEDDLDYDLDSPATMNQKSLKVFFQYMLDVYSAYIVFEDEKVANLDDSLVNLFEHQYLRIEREFERLTLENGNIVESIEQKSNIDSTLSMLLDRQEALFLDVVKFQELRAQLDDHRASLAKTKEGRSAELANIKQDVKEASQRISAFRDKIAAQEFSVDSARRMVKEKERAEQTSHEVRSEREEYSKSLLECDLELNGAMEKLQKLVNENNSRVEALRLVPQAQGVDFKMEFRKDLMHETDQSTMLGGVNLSGRVFDVLGDLESTSKKKTKQETIKHEKLIDELGKADTKLGRVANSIKTANGDKNKKEEILIAEKDGQEEAVLIQQEKVDALEEKINALCDPVALEATIARYQAQCTKLESLRVKQREEALAKKTAMQDEINSALAFVAEFKEHCRSQLEHLETVLTNDIIIDRYEFPQTDAETEPMT